MKKIVSIFMVLLVALALVACDTTKPKPTPELSDKDIINAAKTQLSIGSADFLSKIAGDFELPGTSSVSGKTVTVAWSVKEAGVTAVKVEGAIAKVTRPDVDAENVNATLVAALSYNEEKESKEFAITVLKKEKAPLFKTFAEMKQYLSDNDIKLSDKDDQALPIEFESLTLIGKSTKGYFLSDGASSIYAYGTTTAEIGTKGKVITALRHYFNGYQFVASKTSFEGTTTKVSEADIKAIAKDRTVQNFVDTFASATANLATAKQNLDMMGFFKANVYVYNDPTITTISSSGVNYGVVFRDTNTTTGTDLIQSYYEGTHQDQLKALGTEPRQMTIYASVQEIRDAIKAGPNNADMPIVYRVTVLYYEVELTPEEELTADVTEVKGSVKAAYKNEVSLPETAKNGSTVKWAIKAGAEDATITDGKLVATNPDAHKEITLTATVKLGNLEAQTVEVKTTLGNPTLTVAAFTALKAGLYAKVKATVTGISGNATYTFEDATGATAIFAAKDTSYKVGYEYTVTGTRASSNGGLQQLAPSDAAVEGSAQTLPTAVNVTEAMIKAGLTTYQSKLINISNALVTKTETDSFGNITLTLKVGEETITLKWDSRVKLDADTVAKITNIKKDNVIDVVAAPLGWNNGPVIGYNDLSQIEKQTLTDAEKVELAKNALTLETKYTSVFTLPTTGLQGSTINWAADPASSLVDGKLVIPTEGKVTVSLTATITLGAATDNKVFTVELEYVNEQVIYETGFEAAEGFASGTVYNNETAKLDGADNKKWSILMGTATTTQAGSMGGEQTLQLRWYADKATLGSLTTDFTLNNVTKVVFDSRWHNNGGISVKVSYSTDKTSFIDVETFALTSDKATFTANLPETVTGAIYIRFSLVVGETNPKGTAHLLIDNVKIYGSN